MENGKMNRRDFLRLSAVAATGAVLAACAPAAPVIIEKEVIKEVPVEKPVIIEKEVIKEVPVQKPVIIEKQVIREVPVEKPVIIEKEVIKEIPVEKIVKETVVVEKVVEKPPDKAAAPAALATVVVMHLRYELTEDEEDQFEEDHPGIQIEFLNADASRFCAMYAAGSPPDLLRTEGPAIPQYLGRGMLKDLTAYFEVSDVLKPEDLAPANDYYKANTPLDIGEGKIYGMCKDWSPDFTLFAYKKLFQDAGVDLPSETEPLTYDEIFDLARRLARSDGDQVAVWGYGYADRWMDRIWMNMLAELDTGLYEDDFSSMNLTGNEEAVKVAKYYFDLARENLVANPLNPSPSWNGEDFTKGALALLQYGYWFSAIAQSEVTQGQVVMLPAPMWTGRRRNPPMAATGMIMSQASKVPDPAWEVFEWYNGLEPAVARARSGWGVPALKPMYDLMPQETEYQQQVQRVLREEFRYAGVTMRFNPFIGESTACDSWAKNLDQALRGEIAFEQLLENVQTEVNTAINEGIDRVM